MKPLYKFLTNSCVSTPTDCRTEPNLDDLNLAFQDIGVCLHELEDFVSQVDQVPFIHQLPRYPKPKPCVLHHPRNGEIAERLEQYYDYLPPLVSKLLQNEGFVWLLLLCSLLLTLILKLYYCSNYCRYVLAISKLPLVFVSERASVQHFEFGLHKN